MKRFSPLVLAFGCLLAIALPLNAQVGCLNSPENPTVVLGLVGSAGVFLASARTRLRARRRNASGK